MIAGEANASESKQLLVRHRVSSLRRNLVFLLLLFLLYVGLAGFATGVLRFLGFAGAIVFGVVVFGAGSLGLREVRRSPVALTLDSFGVTFARRDAVPWGVFTEVRFGVVKPRLLFAMRPLHFIAFVPNSLADLPQPARRDRLTAKFYGTPLTIMTETVTPDAEEILAAVEQLGRVPIRR